MSRVLIIAEAGVNHNGSLKQAKELALCAKKAGADIVKYQTFKADAIVSASAQKAEYQRKTTGGGESQLELLRKLELSFDDFYSLAVYCRELGIEFLSTAFDGDSMDFLVKEIGQRSVKIPSGEITNYPLLVKAASYGKPVFLSTGMSTTEEVGEALAVLRSSGSGNVTLLQCTTEYPAPMADVNLAAMRGMGERFGVPVGYSDHTKGIEIAIAAAALGAVVIEKHFTLSRELEGPDHKASLEPDELAAMVSAIRNVGLAIGTGEKFVTKSERSNRDIARRSIVAAEPIRKGEIFSKENLAAKRPGTGLSPMKWKDIIGERAPRDYEKDEQIEL
ncbi:MAG: N-acetylneuraminate synthase [Clostridiales bacterium]|nr:N-acetylneuraminate synthase [Clostridiales bacterium]